MAISMLTMSKRNYRLILILGGSLLLAILLVQTLYLQRRFLPLRPIAQDVDTDGRPKVNFDPSRTHRILYSRSTSTRKYFRIDTRDYDTYNANIIPHPTKNETWIVVSQKSMHRGSWQVSELWCEAQFVKDELVCVDNPLTLTIPSQPGDKCEGRFHENGAILGPHDARAFYTPDFPLTTYGMNSRHTCLGQWAADLRPLMEWETVVGENISVDNFRWPTELQRPPPYSAMEKNWFLFWSTTGDMYAHWSIVPRTYGPLYWNGSAGPDISNSSATEDAKCMAKYMPKLQTTDDEMTETVHQATNSLAVTMCKRGNCDPSDPKNTVILSIFHHKTNKPGGTHPVYEPIPMIFSSAPPFTMIAIAKKPLWINGRGAPGEQNGRVDRPDDESEMLFMTSINWKERGLKYQGFLDDEIFLGFGVEDSWAGGIDVLASEVLQDLGKCGTWWS